MSDDQINCMTAISYSAESRQNVTGTASATYQLARDRVLTVELRPRGIQVTAGPRTGPVAVTIDLERFVDLAFQSESATFPLRTTRGELLDLLKGACPIAGNAEGYVIRYSDIFDRDQDILDVVSLLIQERNAYRTQLRDWKDKYKSVCEAAHTLIKAADDRS